MFQFVTKFKNGSIGNLFKFYELKIIASSEFTLVRYNLNIFPITGFLVDNFSLLSFLTKNLPQVLTITFDRSLTSVIFDLF